jgi:hypothetical protein
VPLENQIISSCRPDTVPDRIRQIRLEKLVVECQATLEEYTQLIHDRSCDVSVEGFVIVGSALTPAFRSGKSDLDVYYLTDSQYNGDFDSYGRVILDGGAYYGKVNHILPDEFRRLDPLGALTHEQIQSKIREPALALEITNDYPYL